LDFHQSCRRPRKLVEHISNDFDLRGTFCGCEPPRKLHCEGVHGSDFSSQHNLSRRPRFGSSDDRSGEIQPLFFIDGVIV